MKGFTDAEVEEMRRADAEIEREFETNPVVEDKLDLQLDDIASDNKAARHRARGIKYYAENKEARLAYSRAYYQLHKDAINARKNKWYQDHKDRARQQQKEYRLAHAEKEADRCNAYRHSHPEQRKANSKAYYNSHQEQCRAYSRAYYQAHKKGDKAKCQQDLAQQSLKQCTAPTSKSTALSD